MKRHPLRRAIVSFAFYALVGASVAGGAYHSVVGPLEPIVFWFWVLPFGLGVGFLGYTRPTPRLAPSEVTAKASIGIRSTSKVFWENVTYKDMEGSLRFLFHTWISVGWIFRTSFFVGLAYAGMQWVLPNNVFELPFSSWNLQILGGLICAVLLWYFSAFWIFNPPKLLNYHTLANNPYSGWLSFFGSMTVGGFCIWMVFFDGFTALRALLR